MARRIFYRGMIRHRERNLVNAMADYHSALKLQPEDPRVLAKLGQVWLESGDAIKAKQYLDQSLKVAPKDWPDRKKVMGLRNNLR